MGDIYRLCYMSVSSLKPANKRPSSKEKDLIGVFSRKSTTLLDDESRVMFINIL